MRWLFYAGLLPLLMAWSTGRLPGRAIIHDAPEDPAEIDELSVW